MKPEVTRQDLSSLTVRPFYLQSIGFEDNITLASARSSSVTAQNAQ